MATLKTLATCMGLLFTFGICSVSEGSSDSEAEELLNGTWYETGDHAKYPTRILKFRNGKLACDTLWKNGEMKTYTVEKDNSRLGKFLIHVEWTAKELRGNGRVIDRNHVLSLVYHTEIVDGKEIPILSEPVIEYDGRGLIFFSEYLKEGTIPALGTKDFVSALKKEHNSRKAIPTSKPVSK